MQTKMFYLQPGGTNTAPSKSRLATPEILTKYNLNLTIRFRSEWGLLFVDRCVEVCHKAGVKYTLLAQSGEAEKPWLLSNITKYAKLADTLSKRYGDDPSLYGVHITGCTPYSVSEELHWRDRATNKYNQVTPTVEAANIKLFNAFNIAFGEKCLLLWAIAPGAPSTMRRLMEYVYEHRHIDQMLFKHNSLKDGTNATAPQMQLLEFAAQELGFKYGFEPACSVVDYPERYEGSYKDMVTKVLDPFTRQVGKPNSYLAVYPPDITLAAKYPR